MNQRFGMIIRSVATNHAETPPDCDELCRRRWADMPHPHCCPDGLYANTPFVTLTNWCSCGALISPPLELDFRDAAAPALAEENGRTAFETFRRHMLADHAIDIERDQAWIDRLAYDAGR